MCFLTVALTAVSGATAVQDLLCAPRPLKCSAPAAQLQKLEAKATITYSADFEHSKEYGMPSTHSYVSIALHLTVPALLQRAGLLLPRSAAIAACAAPLWAAWIALGRMYSLMHSASDVTAGYILGTLSAVLFRASIDATLAWLRHAPWLPLQVLVLSAAAIAVYPTPREPTPSINDIVVFVGATAGIAIGANLGQAKADTQPPMDWSNRQHILLLAGQTLVGILFAVAANEVVARAVRWSLQAVSMLELRYLPGAKQKGTNGSVLVRCHARSVTELS